MTLNETTIKGFDIEEAKLLKYRKNGRTVKYAYLRIPNAELYVPADRLKHIFRYIPYTQRDLFRLPYQERDEAFLNALREVEALRITYDDNGKVYRIVSPEFTAIPHRVVLRLVESIIPPYESRNISYEHGMYAEWILKTVPKELADLNDIVSWKIWCYNYNIGNKALRIGGGFTVLACKNGVTAWKSSARIRIIHRGDYNALIPKIRTAIEKSIYNLISVSSDIKTSLETPFIYDDLAEYLENLLRKYPQYIRYKLQPRLVTAKTFWEASNAFSYVATHYNLPFEQRIKLSNDSLTLLKPQVIKC